MLKNTFLIIVGSESTIFMTIEAKMTQKLTVKAYVLVLEIVENKKARHMYEVVVMNRRPKCTHHGVFTKTSKLFHFPIAIISKAIIMFIAVPVKIQEAQ